MTVGSQIRYTSQRRGVIPAVGEEVPVPLDGIYRRAVVFIVGLRKNERGEEAVTPIGTGFIVRWPGEEPDAPEFYYLVTAKHCIEREQGRTWVRIRVSETEVEDRPVPQWGTHPDHDVAIAPILRGNAYGWAVLGPSTVGSPTDFEPMQLGGRVYFIGLLQGIPRMAAIGLPMVRSGTLGAEHVEGVPVEVGPGTVFRYQAHLIDCRSFSGFSGAPCFIQSDRFMPDADGRVATRTMLLGLIMAHVEIPGLNGDRANAGVGVVAPVERIWEMLMSEDAVEDRRIRTALAREEAAQAEIPAQADSLSDQDSGLTRDQFLRDLTKVTRPVEPPDEGSS